MASAALGQELICSICLDFYTDPVTLRCGHNFCRVCIQQALNTQDGSGVYSCPECRAECRDRPALQRNITVRNAVKNFLSTQPPQEETEIFCTYCVDSPVSAVKSCLHCEACLCDKHWRSHSKGPEHVLTDPSRSLGRKKCPIHKKILEYYCNQDATCICVSCCLVGDHRGHNMESLDDASEKKKKKLKGVLQKLTTKRQKTQIRVQRLEERRRRAQEKAIGDAERMTALFIDLRRRLDNMEKEILGEISMWVEKESCLLSDVIQKLEIEKEELSKKMQDIEKMCNMTDPLTVLQESDTGDLYDPWEKGDDKDTGGPDRGDEDTGGPDGGDEDTGGPDGGDEGKERHDEGHEGKGRHDGGHEGKGQHDGGDEDTGGPDGGDVDKVRHDGDDEDMGKLDEGDQDPKLIPPLSHSLHDIIRHVIFYGQDPTDISLDINTANNNLLISDDLKTATWTLTRKNRPDTAERFQDFPQVMSSSDITSGRHYWDVEISGSELWRVGVCYPSIDRKGRQSYIGDNNKSWGLYGGRVYNNQYSVIHNSKVIQLPHQISSDRVRIYVDYEEGELSFYALCDPLRHLHTFTTRFTEPLHAVLRVMVGSINIAGGEVTGQI
ncbi:E3 ubiquitin-protein ligase TRIM39-like [Engystomops pustulosus]|uniref:E3 ubiquitin-protein ligase TRIM39-like n=1 Tax=Engystomops pustulosus TaxID=76066 RepID=UPI003AFA62A4